MVLITEKSGDNLYSDLVSLKHLDQAETAHMPHTDVCIYIYIYIHVYSDSWARGGKRGHSSESNGEERALKCYL